MNKILDIKSLSIGYQSEIQKDINVELYEGQFVCLIGPNGIGKSTFLKTISNVIPAISGEVILQEENLLNLNSKDLSKLISLVLTDHIDGFNLRAIDVIRMGRYPHTGFWGKLNSEDVKIIEEYVRQIEIENLINRQFSELSDGEKQKVMIAKALVQQAPLMLLDEPTAFLDFPTKANLLVLLRKLAKNNNLGIILSTHDIELALKTADQIWLFTENHQLIKGMPEDLVLDGHINRVFNNKEMQFNPVSGNFERLSKCEKAVKLIGNSSPVFWLGKALQRNEIAIDDSSQVAIQYKDKFILTKNNQSPTIHFSIEEVLCELKKIL